jgi:general secretion pathway protein L
MSRPAAFRRAKEDIAAAGRHFIHWWLAQLAGSVPVRLRTKFAHPADAAVIRIEGDTLRVVTKNGIVEIERDKSGAFNIPGNSKTSEERGAIVILPTRDAHIDRFKIPAGAEGKLKQAVSFEVERRSPFRGPDALFDFAVTGRDEENHSLDIEWATVPSSVVEDARKTALQIGYYPLAIGLAGEVGNSLKYVFCRQKPRRARGERLAAAVFLAALAFLIAANSYVAVEHARGQHRAETDLAALKPQAEGALKTETAGKAMVAALGVVKKRASESNALDVLEALSKALPDDTWIDSFDLNENQLRITGYSASASPLIEKLAAVPLFDHPQFRAPITLDGAPARGKEIERFDIALVIHNRAIAEGRR